MRRRLTLLDQVQRILDLPIREHLPAPTQIRTGRAFKVLDAFVEAGGTRIDTADVYGGSTSVETRG